MTLVDPSQVRVDVTVDETDVAKIAVGKNATITFDALPDRPFRGKVLAISPTGTLTQGVVSYPVSLSIDARNQVLPAGMTASTTITIDEKNDVLIVPNRAVRRQGREQVVEVMGEDGKPATRPVRTGVQNDTLVEITDGLNEGDQVLIQGTTTRQPSLGGAGGGPGGPGGGPAVEPCGNPSSMIDGVQCKPLKVLLDDRGAFMELLREDDPFYTRFGQSNFSITYPGVVKAWHYHNQQDDLWFIVSGTGRSACTTCARTRRRAVRPTSSSWASRTERCCISRTASPMATASSAPSRWAWCTSRPTSTTRPTSCVDPGMTRPSASTGPR